MTARSVLIVGANSAIALATAREFRESGAVIAGIGLDDAGADAYDAFAVADCGDPDEARAAVDRLVGELGGLDTVVLGAAFMDAAPLEQTTDDDWRRTVSAVLDCAFYVSRAASPHLSDGGAIVAISSVNAVLVAPWLPAYSAAKAGLEGLVRQLAVELSPRGIRVNAVRPGAISTDEGFDHAGYPLGRAGRPEEVARAIHFLGTEASSFSTGSILTVDGGLSIVSPVAWLRPDMRDRWL
ncbi:MAG: family oxidoreductase [Microbacteriaceae bacterium]|nr:family oxidoreductase [Microbacteriaceae bacterium]